MCKLGKEIENALDGLVGVVRMQCRNAQVTRLGVMQCVLHGRAVTYLANHDDVGCLAHGPAQGLVIRPGVDSHLTLRHERFLVAVQILDGIFNGEDMPAGVGIAVIQQRREGGGLARTSGAHRQNKPSFEKRQIFQNGRHAERVQRCNTGGHMADHHAHLPALPVHVDTKAFSLALSVRQGVGKVALQGGVELMLLRRTHEGVGHGANVMRLQYRRTDGEKLPLALDGGRSLRQQKQIRAAPCGDKRQVRQQSGIRIKCRHSHPLCDCSGTPRCSCVPQ